MLRFLEVLRSSEKIKYLMRKMVDDLKEQDREEKEEKQVATAVAQKSSPPTIPLQKMKRLNEQCIALLSNLKQLGDPLAHEQKFIKLRDSAFTAIQAVNGLNISGLLSDLIEQDDFKLVHAVQFNLINLQIMLGNLFVQLGNRVCQMAEALKSYPSMVTECNKRIDSFYEQAQNLFSSANRNKEALLKISDNLPGIFLDAEAIPEQQSSSVSSSPPHSVHRVGGN